MRWLVTGAAGMLGSAAVGLLRERGEEVSALARNELDVTSAVAVESAVIGHDIVLNCAAWTAVDEAEEREGQAFEINALGAANLARSASGAGARLVHVSTDYVFNGQARSPYGTSASMHPLSAYGRTKLAGEWAVRAELPRSHYVVRTAWLYGAGGRCFPKVIAHVAAAQGSVSVVDDQFGQPTWVEDVADLVHRLVEADAPPGTYNATSSGQATWYEFAQAICESAGLGGDVVVPTSSGQLVRPAPRPAYSVLDHGDLKGVGLAPIPHWRARWKEAASSVLGLSR